MMFSSIQRLSVLISKRVGVNGSSRLKMTGRSA
jgi:hypothetical protein